MSSYSDYYETNLYPLQDGVLRCVEESSAGFFLTGGTALSRVYKFHWEEIVEETRQKEAGFEVPLAAEILLGFPEAEFHALKWKTPPRWEDFFAGLKQIVFDLTRGKENTLAG